MPIKDNSLRILVLATKNKNKITEIKIILGDLFHYKLISDYYSFSIREFGNTLIDNSLTKAQMAFKLSNLPSLADDSGLFVDALDGEPGVYSARYGSNDQKRIDRLLNNLVGIVDRRAVFRAVFVYYYRPKVYWVFNGECPGTIAREPRGHKGFGYDPVFIPKGYKQTFAEMDSECKNQISHRAKALFKFKTFIVKKNPTTE